MKISGQGRHQENRTIETNDDKRSVPMHSGCMAWLQDTNDTDNRYIIMVELKSWCAGSRRPPAQVFDEFNTSKETDSQAYNVRLIDCA